MKHELESVIAKACAELFNNPDIKVELTRTDEQFGDFATNVALKLTKQVGESPQAVAEKLAAYLREKTSDKVSQVTVAGPGFLNLKLNDKSLLESLSAEVKPAVYAGQKIVIETNNPNPFKDMHIGHAFNSIVADTLANLLQAGQADLHRVSYHGDVGLHVGKSMWAILKFLDGDASKLEQIPEAERPKFLSQKYAEGVDAYDEDELAKQEIEELAKQSFMLDDPQFKQVYDMCKSWSFAYFDQIFVRLGSKPIEHRYLESDADKAGREVVEAHIGDIFKQSDGAVIFPGEKYDLHTRVFISSRGTTLYEARDLGLMQLKQNDFHPQASYIVTAVEQKEYFRVVFKAAELALPELAGITRNIPTGTVKLATGKMSSRRGTFINIGWLFDEIKKALIERGADEQNANDGVVGALRYTMLKNRLGGDVTFEVSEAISLDGNSGPYLQYAHARARSILNKAGAKKREAGADDLQAGERSLARKMSEYPEVIEQAVQELMPHHVCTYLYELAQEFNRFYEHNRVLGDEREVARLKLIKGYAEILKNGLNLLGIPAPDKM